MEWLVFFITGLCGLCAGLYAGLNIVKKMFFDALRREAATLSPRYESPGERPPPTPKPPKSTVH